MGSSPPCSGWAVALSTSSISRSAGRVAALRAQLAAAAGLLISFLVVWAAAPAHASTATVARETSDLLLWRAGDRGC